MTDKDYSELIWTDDDGNTYIGPLTITWEGTITPADIDALKQENPPLSGRLIGYWPLAKDEGEDA